MRKKKLMHANQSISVLLMSKIYLSTHISGAHTKLKNFNLMHH